MTKTVGDHAIVVGAGMGGLAAAAALSPVFAKVTVLDKDDLSGSGVRLGVGQGSHTHQLLKAGEDTLERMLPGIRAELYAAGGHQIRVGKDVTVLDAMGLLPEHDTGFTVTALSRPKYEGILRARVAALPNVSLRGDTPVAGARIENGRCLGVTLGDGEQLDADLVIDASGMNGPLSAQLAADGAAEYETETVGINVAYTTAIFEKPAAWRGNNQGMFVLPGPPSKHFALLLPIEDDQWTISLGARGGAPMPKDREEFLAFAKELALPGVFERISEAKATTPYRTFRKPQAVRRKFGAAAKWPERLLPLGDAITHFNPTFGQGMTVAALQAGQLARLLGERAASGGGLDGLAAAYFSPAEGVAAAAWGLALSVDYAFDETVGERPADFAQSQFAGRVMRQMAQTDMEIFTLRLRVGHMLESPAAMREGPLGERIGTAIRAAAAAG